MPSCNFDSVAGPGKLSSASAFLYGASNVALSRSGFCISICSGIRLYTFVWYPKLLCKVLVAEFKFGKLAKLAD